MPLSAYYTAPLWLFGNRPEWSFLLEFQYPRPYAYAGTVLGFLMVQKGSRVTGLWKVSGTTRAPITPLAWEAPRSEKVGKICPFLATNGFGPDLEVKNTPKLLPCRWGSYGDFSTVFWPFFALFGHVGKMVIFGLIFFGVIFLRNFAQKIVKKW